MDFVGGVSRAGGKRGIDDFNKEIRLKSSNTRLPPGHASYEFYQIDAFTFLPCYLLHKRWKYCHANCFTLLINIIREKFIIHVFGISFTSLCWFSASMAWLTEGVSQNNVRARGLNVINDARLIPCSAQ